MRNPLSLLTLGPLVLALSVIFIFSAPSTVSSSPDTVTVTVTKK